MVTIGWSNEQRRGSRHKRHKKKNEKAHKIIKRLREFCQEKLGVAHTRCQPLIVATKPAKVYNSERNVAYTCKIWHINALYINTYQHLAVAAK